MDPAIANQNLDPPRERVLVRGLVPALLVNALIMGALVLGLNWKFGGEGSQLPFDSQREASSAANDTSRMGGAPTPPSEAPVPAWPSAAVANVAATPQAVDPAPRAIEPSARVEAPARADTRMEANVKPPVAEPKVQAVQPKTQVAALTTRPAAPTRTESPPPALAGDPRMQPSFDCAKARSATERLICRDPQLARLDRELGRVHAQAKRAAPDPLDFKRENDEEWRLREAVCRDKDCLLEWYAHRRQQLQQRIAQSR